MYMKGFTLYLYLFVVSEVATDEGLEQVKFEDYCGLSITRDGGTVRLDGGALPGTPDTCSLTITADMRSLYQTYMMFYFTEFELFPESCDDSRLEITDDDDELHVVKGLPRYLCGHNRTVEEEGRFYRTLDDRLTLTLRRGYGFSTVGKFSINFVAFHEGVCAGTEEHECPSKQCILSKYLCHTELKSCGEPEDESCKVDQDTAEAIKNLLDSILSVVRNYSWIIFVIVAFCVLKACLRRYKDRVCQRIKSCRRRGSQPVQRECVEMGLSRTVAEDDLDSNGLTPTRRLSLDSNNSVLATDHHRTPDSEPNNIDFQLRNTDFGLNSASDTSGYYGECAGTPPSDRHTLPSAPPPSYEEAVAPSYDECMSNSDKYAVK